VPPVVDIFFSGYCRSMIRAPTSGMTAFGSTKVSPKRELKPLRDVTRELNVLALVVPDRHLIGVVEQDVSDHQHRVAEDPAETNSCCADLSLNCVIRCNSP